ncbi:MAG TPA: FG-GAP-like repeat-containing protein, partial [Allosphingosinicella sp.]|nr:FG-GAP-like repeat-containing protein [Allosphingosinicella sp.]
MPGYPSTLDLANLGSFGFVLRGETITDNAGFSVSSAGDINNDGYADVIVGSPSSNRAYVVFGKAGGFGTVFLGSLTPADGFRITGEVSTDAAGYSVASAGDINNDGYDDIILGAELLGGFNEGAAYVLFGKASGFADISLATLAASDGFKISGDTTIGRLGHSVASAGDYNNDGYDDIIVGAPDDNAGNTGHAYLIFGKATGFGPVNVLALGPTDGFAITGAAAGDNAGNSVSSAGDVNNDGYDDLIIGAPLNDSGGASSGAAYVLFGRAVGFGPINLAALTPADGFKIQGLTGNQAGTAVATAGDFNGDGYADLLVGSPLVSRSGNSQVGEAYLIFGKASGFTTINLNTIAPADGFRVINTGPFDHAGASVSAAGDVNGDGYDDLIVGVPGADLSSGNDGGEAFIVFGKASGFGPIDLATMTARDGFEIQGAEPGDLAGTGIGAAGDVNNDGYDDIIVGSPGALGSNEGAAYVVFGRSTAGTATIDNGATDDHYVTSYTEQGSEAGVSDGNVTLSSGAPINSMTITISDPRNGDRMTLAGPLPAGISASVDWSVIVLSGSASNADYAAALAQVRYSSVSDNPTDYGTDQDRTILIRVDTDVGSQLIGTAAISVIGVDDPAVARDDDFGLLENVSSFISSVFTSHGHGADFDPDNQGAGALTVTQVNGSAANVGNAFVLPSGAILRLNANGSFSYEPNHAFDSTPAPGSGATNQPAFDSFTYTLAGGSTATVTMTITGVDSADFLVGPAGPNTLAGGNGNDTYLLDDPNDLVIETAGGGARDVVYVPFSYTLGQGVYVEVLSTSSQAGTAPLVLVGNELGQEILGNA